VYRKISIASNGFILKNHFGPKNSIFFENFKFYEIFFVGLNLEALGGRDLIFSCFSGFIIKEGEEISEFCV